MILNEKATEENDAITVMRGCHVHSIQVSYSHPTGTSSSQCCEAQFHHVECQLSLGAQALHGACEERFASVEVVAVRNWAIEIAG